jgi:hypothetical protein
MPCRIFQQSWILPPTANIKRERVREGASAQMIIFAAIWNVSKYV